MIDPIGDGHTYLKNSACYVHRELILKRWEIGDSLAEIAGQVGTSRRLVTAFLKRQGVYEFRGYGLKREKSPHWKGGRTMSRGYVRVHYPEHPYANKPTGYVFEHRLVMEKMIGRYLEPKEVVHHRDGNKSNNDPSNLQLFSENREHLAHELKGKCPKWSEEGKKRILEATLKTGTDAMRQGYRQFADARTARIQKEIADGARGLRLGRPPKKA